jgi:hypothetical protein
MSGIRPGNPGNMGKPGISGKLPIPNVHSEEPLASRIETPPNTVTSFFVSLS